jgi:hypothetical protein
MYIEDAWRGKTIVLWRYSVYASVVYSDRSEFHYFDESMMFCGELLAYFPYFEKIRVGLWDYVAVCVCIHPPH